jgi:predicted DCC family thiol-disulfide oxidoreductase YuxK
MVLYDAGCGFCVRCRRWLQMQRALVPLEFIPAATPEARSRFPRLRHPDPPEELVIVDDEGGVYRGADAWIIVLYALEEYREWSLRLARPVLRPLARAAFEWLSRNRKGLSRQLGLASEAHVVETLSPYPTTTCAPRAGGDAACTTGRKG